MKRPLIQERKRDLRHSAANPHLDDITVFIEDSTVTGGRSGALPGTGRPLGKFQSNRAAAPGEELIVLDDGTDPVADLLTDDERVRFVRLTNRRTQSGLRAGTRFIEDEFSRRSHLLVSSHTYFGIKS
jgi:hypothetical protein